MDDNVLNSLRSDMLKQNPVELKKALTEMNLKLKDAKRSDLLYAIVVLGAKIASLTEAIDELNSDILKLKGGK